MSAKLSGVSTPENVQLIRPEQLSDRAPYAYVAVAARGSLLVFAAGACPLDQKGEVVGIGDLAGQAAKCLENLAIALQAAGASLNDVVKTTVYVASSDRKDLLTAWNVVEAAFEGHRAPSTLLGVSCRSKQPQLWTRWLEGPTHKTWITRDSPSSSGE